MCTHDEHRTTQSSPVSREDDLNACSEYNELSRRNFLKRSSLATAGLLSTPAWLPKVVLGNGNKRGGQAPDVLVSIFWRGGPDLLSQAIPFSDPWLYQAPYDSGSEFFPNGLRPTIGIAPPDPRDPDPNALRCLDTGSRGVVGPDAFGLNKAYADREYQGQFDRNNIFDFFNAGEVAFIPAAGSPDTNRSHFVAESLIEYATPNQLPNELTGWLARYLTLVPSLGGPLRAAALTSNTLLPKMLAFAEQTLAFQEIEDVVLPGNAKTAKAREQILSARYAAQTEEPLQGSVLNAFEVINLLEQV
ncbi:MAG: twin-arginine translocation signal domain-containing protein, partial [Phycisphaerae bacterium]